MAAKARLLLMAFCFVQVLCDIAGCLITCLTCKLILEQASGILLATG